MSPLSVKFTSTPEVCIPASPLPVSQVFVSISLNPTGQSVFSSSTFSFEKCSSNYYPMISHCLQYTNSFLLLRHSRPSWSDLGFPIQLNSSLLHPPPLALYPLGLGQHAAPLDLCAFA